MSAPPRYLELLLVTACVGWFSWMGCNEKSIQTDQVPLARVFDQYLYLSDLPTSFQHEAFTSLRKKTFVKNWVENQLLLKKAALNVDPKDPDLQRMVEDYHNSLLIYKYQKQVLAQLLDTHITATHVHEYAQSHGFDFEIDTLAIDSGYAGHQIAQIILNTRKQELLKKMKAELYQDALSRGKMEIYAYEQ